MPKHKVKISPSFLLLFFWFVFFKDIFSFLIFITVVLSHEYGHFIVAKKLGYKLKAFVLAPYGAKLSYEERFFDSKDEILIALAGPLMNIFLSVFLISFWWITPNIYSFTIDFVRQSLLLGLFNLLPCYPLDGGRVFIGILSQNIERKRAVKIIYILNYCFSFLLFLCFIISCFINFNPTFCLCSVFLLLGVFDSKYESKYQAMLFMNKEIKNFSKPLIFVINDNVTIKQLLKHIEINKFTIFIVNLANGKTKVLSENVIKDYAIKYPINLKLKEILF